MAFFCIYRHSHRGDPGFVPSVYCDKKNQREAARAKNGSNSSSGTASTSSGNTTQSKTGLSTTTNTASTGLSAVQQAFRTSQEVAESRGSADEVSLLVGDRSVVDTLVADTKYITDPAERADAICFSCMLVKPLRSKHCASNNRCIHRFDHFCVWIGQTVGAANHRLFIAYAVLQVLCSCAYWWLGITYLRAAHGNEADWLEWIWVMVSQEKLTLWALFMTGGAWLFGVVMAGQHLQMASMNVTTNEQINLHRYDHFFREVIVHGQPSRQLVNPFDQGSKRANLLEFFQLKKPKSVSREAIVAEKQVRNCFIRHTTALHRMSGHSPLSASHAVPRTPSLYT